MEIPIDVQREMFWSMLLARRMDERAWALHRQGKIAFHVSGIGHEAAQVGAAFALRRGYDYVAPYYRDLAMMVALGFTPRQFALSLMGKREEPGSGGRQMPSHFSSRSLNVVSHSSPVATQCVHAAGIGLAIKLRHEDRAVLTSLGEGSTAQGEWYEAVNWAAVHNLPVIFLVENNMYAISEPVEKEMAVKSAAEKACGLGLPGYQVDGTDLLAMYEATCTAVERARAGGGPTLIEARMYRMTPHSSDDDDRTYRSREEVEEHKKRDPMILAQAALEKNGSLDAGSLEDMEKRAKELIDAAVQYAEKAPYPSEDEAAHPVYAEEVVHA